MNLFQPPQPLPLSLRYYQREAIDAAYDFLRRRKDNPCIVLPTGAGKTPVMAQLCHDVVSRWNGRVIVLSHVKELIEQTSKTLSEWFPDLNVGVYSAGLNKRDTKSDVLVAGIQSIYKRGLQIAGSNPFNIVLVDEAHRIPTEGEGMYRQLLKDLAVASPRIRVIGLTATPYRLKGGYVCGPDHFLNDICYEAGVKELIAKGYLCPLVSKQSVHSVDSDQLGTRNGEFRAEDLSQAFDGDEVVEQACDEIVKRTLERKSIIIFCCDVKHAEHVQQCLHEMTEEQIGLVTGDSSDRDETIDAFKKGRIRFLVNVNVLTEGFDARQVDCVVLLRSTLSPGLYYQMVGRGLRTHDAKADCLVLDFGGNVLRHGCIDAIQIKSGTVGSGDKPSKVCEQCQEVVGAGYQICPVCGHEFPQREERGPNHEARSYDTPITTDQIKGIRWEISEVCYYEHVKRGADEGTPRTMRVDYFAKFEKVCSEWVCIEHEGWAREKALQWWSERCGLPMPDTAAEAAQLGQAGAIAAPIAIHTHKLPGEKFTNIIKYELGEIPNPSTMVEVEDEWGQVTLVRQPGEDDEVYEPSYDWIDVDELPF